MSSAIASSLAPSSRQDCRVGCFGSSPPCSSCGRSARRSRHAAMRPGRLRTASASAACAASTSRHSATARSTRASSPSAASSLLPCSATCRWPGACSSGTPISAARWRSPCHARSKRPASSRSRVRSSASTASSRPARAPGMAWRWWVATGRAASPSASSRLRPASRSAAPSSRQAACWGSSSMGQSLRRRRPAELRPAPPMAAHALDQAAHLAVPREMPLVLRQHGVDKTAHVLRQVLDLRQRRRPRHHVPVAREEERNRVRLLALTQKCPPVRRQRRELFGVHHGGLGKVDPQSLQRTVLDPVLRLQALDQSLAVVGQQQERLRDPAELDMEQLEVDPAACIQHRDCPPRRPALCGMNGRAIRVIEMAQLRVAERETELPLPVAEAHTLVSDLHDLRLAAVDQVRRLWMAAAGAGCLAVARPADPVAGAQLDPLGVVEAQIARRIARGPKAAFAVRMGQHDPAVVVTHDDADVVRAAAEDVAMEHDGIAGLVAPQVGGLHPGEPPIDQAVDGEHAAPQHAFVREPLAHGVVRLPADRVRGGEDQGVRPMLRRQREPAASRLPSKLLRRRLKHPIAQRRNRCARLPFPRKTRRSPQLRVALAHHLLHRRRRHARLLQQTEGLPCIHRLQLFDVAHQYDPRHIQRARDAQQRLHANAADHRGLVHRQNPPPILRPGHAPAAPGRRGRRSGSGSTAASVRGCRPPWREPGRRRPRAPGPVSSGLRHECLRHECPRGAPSPRSAWSSCRCRHGPARRSRGRSTTAPCAPPPSGPG